MERGANSVKLYFSNTTTIITTILILILIGFMSYCFINRDNIQFWGRRILILVIYGLVVCCFAAARDGLDITIQNAVEGTAIAGGIFELVSIPTIIGCIGAGIIIISSIISLFVKSQNVREILFFIGASKKTTVAPAKKPTAPIKTFSLLSTFPYLYILNTSYFYTIQIFKFCTKFYLSYYFPSNSSYPYSYYY